ncbi:MAG: ATP synthase F0 subunit C [Chloroflexi bacterium]|nr:ATP synthase F0 subunit C [Chloroflexota bacterium]
MDSGLLITLVTIIVTALAISIGTIVPSLMEGWAVVKALDGIARQPEAADSIRATLFVSIALLESVAIYVLLICLILLFANPLVGRVLGS